jgi:peptide/nickel transport system ATP-binding protein
MPEFTAASTPGHRFRCHHPVEEGRSTRTLVAQAESAAGATAMADVPFQQHIREP